MVFSWESWDFLRPSNVSYGKLMDVQEKQSPFLMGESCLHTCSRIAPIDSCTSHAGTSPAAWIGKKQRINTQGGPFAYTKMSEM